MLVIKSDAFQSELVGPLDFVGVVLRIAAGQNLRTDFVHLRDDGTTVGQDLFFVDRLTIDYVIMRAFNPKVSQSTSLRREPEVEIFDCFDRMFIGVADRPAIGFNRYTAMLFNASARWRCRRQERLECKSVDLGRKSVVS